MEELLSATIHTAVDVGAVKKSEFKPVIVDTTVQEKAITHSVESRLLEIARRKVVAAAKRCGYAHAKQFKRLRRVVKRQRTILGILIRLLKRRKAVEPAIGLSKSDNRI